MNEWFGRWSLLFTLSLKRDWKKIFLWILGVGLFSAALVPVFEELAKGEGFKGLFQTFQNPAMTSIVGQTPVTEASHYTVGAMYAHQMLLFCCLFSMIVSMFHVITHTRKAEDEGLIEMIRSYQVGRLASSFAIIVEVIIINLLLTVFINMIMIAFGVDTVTFQGSFMFAASIGTAGLMGGVIALFFAQIMPSSSLTVGSSLGVIIFLYLLRAVTDIAFLSGTTWNPLGWLYLTYPFTENNGFFLIYSLLFLAGLLILAFIIESKRDMGAGYLPERAGRAYAKPSLLSLPGLWIRLNRMTIIGWFITFFLLGAVYGAVYGDMEEFVHSNELIQQMFLATEYTLEESFTAVILMVMTCIIALLPIVTIHKLFVEEHQGRLSQFFATKITRKQLFYTTIALAVILGMISVFFMAGSLGITALVVMEEQTNLMFLDFIVAGYNYFPAILFYISLSALAVGWAPQVRIGVYVYVTYSFIIQYVDGLVELPQGLLIIAIQSWLPQMPMEDFDSFTFMMIMFLSVILIIIGSIGYKRRDLHEIG